MKEKKGKNLVIALTMLAAGLLCLNIYQFLDKKDNLNDNGDKYLTLVEGHRVKVESNDAKVLRIIGTNNNYVLYSDNGLNLYEIETGKISKINLDVENFDNLYIYQMPNGLLYRDSSRSDINGFYNFETKSVSLKNKYDSLERIYDEYRDVTDYLKAWNKGMVYVIDSITGEVIITEQPKTVKVERDYIITYILSEGTGGGHNEYGYTIYNTEGKKIAELEDDETYDIKDWGLVIYKEKKLIPLS